MRRDFVKAVRTVSLLAIFSKDVNLAGSAITTLRCCAHFEPDLVLPLVLERVYPALEGLLETQRTISVRTVRWL
jgi:proteasome activator subunit 4